MKRILSPRSFLIGSGCLCAILLILIFPKPAVSAAKEAVDTWLRIILPTLLPVSVLADLLLQSGTARLFTAKIGRPISRFFGFSPNFCYIFVMSLLSGYPVGARLTAALYEQKQITQKEASLMLNAASTSGPSFLVMGVSLGMLGSSRFGPVLLLSHVLSAIITAYINGHLPHASFVASPAPPQNKSAGAMFLSSVSQSTSGMLIVLGAMVLFGSVSAACSHLAALLFPAHQTVFSAILSGILEFSTGCQRAAMLQPALSLPLISFFCGFGSLSVYLQTCAVAAKSNLPLCRLMGSKLLQGALSGFFVALLLLPRSAEMLPGLLFFALLSLLALLRLKNIPRKKPAVQTVG